MTNTPQMVASMMRKLADDIDKHNRSAGPGVWQGDDGFWLRTADFLESHPDSELARIIVRGLAPSDDEGPLLVQPTMARQDAKSLDKVLRDEHSLLSKGKQVTPLLLTRAVFQVTRNADPVRLADVVRLWDGVVPFEGGTLRLSKAIVEAWLAKQ